LASSLLFDEKSAKVFSAQTVLQPPSADPKPSSNHEINGRTFIRERFVRKEDGLRTYCLVHPIQELGDKMHFYQKRITALKMIKSKFFKRVTVDDLTGDFTTLTPI
jgi:hypothetical protein